MVTTPEFWDCSCESRYIHPRVHNFCPTCGAERDESSDARPEEVVRMELHWKPREEPPYETVESTVERLDGRVKYLEESLKRLRHQIWSKDIPSPTTPEYREWHENCQKFMKHIDTIIGEE